MGGDAWEGTRGLLHRDSRTHVHPQVPLTFLQEVGGDSWLHFRVAGVFVRAPDGGIRGIGVQGALSLFSRRGLRRSQCEEDEGGRPPPRLSYRWEKPMDAPVPRRRCSFSAALDLSIPSQEKR